MKVLLLIFSWLSTYLPLLLSFFTKRSWKHYMWFYLIFGGLSEVISAIVKHGYHKPMDGVANVYLIGELIVYSYFLFKILFGTNHKGLIIGVIAIWVTFNLWINFGTFWTSMNMIGIGLNCFIFIFLSLLVYRNILLKQEFEKLTSNPDFWFNTGIFIYASGGCLFFLLLDKVLEEDTDFLITLWLTFYGVINLLRYTFIGIGLNRLGRNERI